MGGCTYSDLTTISLEQSESLGDVPGPLPVICSDLIVDVVQVARAKAAGAEAVSIQWDVVGGEMTSTFTSAAHALGMEVVVEVSTVEGIKGAISGGAEIVLLNTPQEDIETKIEWRKEHVPDGVTAICAIAAADDKALGEVEDAWRLRDGGFQGVWVSDCLFKAGADPTEHAGAIINAMKSKSSVKFASPRSKSGRGEGAREYLGDILM